MGANLSRENKFVVKNLTSQILLDFTLIYTQLLNNLFR